MQRFIRSLTALASSAALIFASALAAEAYSIRVEYTCEVTSVGDPAGALNGTVSLGLEYSGYYTLDSTAPSSPPLPSDERGIYYSDLATFPHEIVLGPFVHRSADALDDTPYSIVVVINDSPPASPQDAYQTGHYEATTRTVTPESGEPYALLINFVSLQLADSSAVALEGVELPLFLELDDWPDQRAVWIGGGKDLNRDGRIDTSPPFSEPRFTVGGELISLRVVIDPADMTRDLVDTVIDLNVARGIANASDPKLRMVLKALDAVHAGDANLAVSALRAFTMMVAAQAGKALSEEEAAELMALAEDVVAVLERAGEA